MRIAYLGPAGTFTEDALGEAAPAASSSRCARRRSTTRSSRSSDGEADRALVPFENSIEGSVRRTLDTLAFEADGGDDRRRVRLRGAGPPDRPRGGRARARSRRSSPTPSRSPSAPASCASSLPEVELRSVSSTAAAVRMVGESHRPWAALGARAAAELYGCTILREGDRGRGRQRHPLRLDRPGRDRAGRRRPRGRPRWSSPSSARTIPGALVEALSEFSCRAINLTRIESRPLRQGLGRYMFFCDLEGAATDPTVAEAIAALRTKAESVRLSAPIRVR